MSRLHRDDFPLGSLARDPRNWVMVDGIYRPRVRGGTTFTGVETLAQMSADAGAVGPTASLLSVLTRECLQPVSPAYVNQIGRRLHIKASGVIDTTAVVPTYQLQLVVGPTYANPLTTGQMLAQNAAITPAVSLTGSLEFWLDVEISIRAVGSSASMRAYGTLLNDWALSGTYVITPFKNATPPTAVVLTGTGGGLVNLYFDIEVIMAAATAGNTVTCVDYRLQSQN
jgi:hypothetical protein